LPSTKAATIRARFVVLNWFIAVQPCLIIGDITANVKLYLYFILPLYCAYCV
jgi:hypothetical protein